MIELGTKTFDMILTEKQQKYWHYMGEIDKYEYVKGRNVLTPDQNGMIKQAKCFNLTGKK